MRPLGLLTFAIKLLRQIEKWRSRPASCRAGGGDVHVSAELRVLFFSFSNWIFKMYNSDHTQINFPADQEDCTFIHLVIYLFYNRNLAIST